MSYLERYIRDNFDSYISYYQKYTATLPSPANIRRYIRRYSDESTEIFEERYIESDSDDEKISDSVNRNLGLIYNF